jgi:hypothetical protein
MDLLTPHQERLGRQFLPIVQAALNSFGISCRLDDQLPALTLNLGYVLGADDGPKIRLEIDSYFVGTNLIGKVSDQCKINLLIDKLGSLDKSDRPLLIV